MKQPLLWQIVLLMLLLSPLGTAEAMPTMEPALCTRSANLLACSDLDGNFYSVQSHGNTLFLRGYEVQEKRSWAQSSTRYGQLTFYTGVASDGETWVGYSRRVGWTTLNRVSSSSRQRFDLRCNRLGGCQ